MFLCSILILVLGVAGCSPGDAGTNWSGTKSRPTRTANLVNTVGMELVQVPAGSFATDAGYGHSKNRAKSEILHTITLSKSFYMGAYEVTQSQYEKVVGANPSYFRYDAVLDMKRPVEMISWKQAVEFCRRLSDLPDEKAAGRVYRLPTEAEWEYAYRAGSPTKVTLPVDAKELEKITWCLENSALKTKPVGGKAPNAWGLYDMVGNVEEYCADWSADDYPASNIIDPKGPKWKPTYDRRRYARVTRGNNYNVSIHMGTNLRYERMEQDPAPWIGFRVVMQHGCDLETSDVLSDFLEADPELLRLDLQRVQSKWDSAMPLLNKIANGPAATDADLSRRFLARVALASQDPSRFGEVFEDFSIQQLPYFYPMAEILQPQLSVAQEQLKQLAVNQQEALHRRLFAINALDRSAPETMQTLWNSEWEKQFTQELTQQCRDESIKYFYWIQQSICRDVLRPYREKLRSELIHVFEKSARNKLEIEETNQAMAVLADFFSDDPLLLTDLLIDAPLGQRRVAMDAIRRLDRFRSDGRQVTIDRSALGPEVLEKLSRVVQTPPPKDLDASQRVQFGRRRLNAASYFSELGEFDKVLSIFDWKDDPEVIAQWICQTPRDRWGPSLDFAFGLPPGKIRDTALHAILLSNPDPPAGPMSDTQKFFAQVLDWYANEPSSAVHSAARWYLKKHSQHTQVDKVDENPVPYSSNREWFTMKIPLRQPTSKSVPLRPYEYTYLTFVVFQPGDYVIEPMEIAYEQDQEISRKTLVLHRPVAILDREISMEEWNAFRSGRILQRDFPSEKFSWYDCVAFCRWLTAQAGMDEASQVYAAPETADGNLAQFNPIGNAQNPPTDWPYELDKAGFRLPTETEWEVAARGGTSTAYGFGNDESLLPNYAWSEQSDYRHMSTSLSKSRLMEGRSLRPNFRGLFDMHGNYEEWVNDWYEPGLDRSPDDRQRFRVLRGGSADDTERTRSGARSKESPDRNSPSKSFRLAITLPNRSTEDSKKPE
jgi:formylglycine-generating enzyme required for sulfatase activity